MFLRTQLLLYSQEYSIFLWGARQTGKTTLIKQLYPEAIFFDLLKNDLYRNFLNNPENFRNIVLASPITNPIVIDEVQKLPMLLDEVHWLIENSSHRFILSGSSPRKILNANVNLLGGRALKHKLYPLSYSEIENFDLTKALNNGLLPRHYLAKNAEPLIAAYIGNYLEDEIVAETKLRNVEIFSKFLDKVAFSNGEIVNYTNIAAECHVKSPTIKEYFNILNQSMIGGFVQAYQKSPKRRIVNAPKFYFFDVGIANFLLKRKNIEYGSTNFGFAFEHFIYMELKCYSQYSGKNFEINYWRTSSGFEVDFVLNNAEVAIEVKSANDIQPKHVKGLKAFNEEYKPKKNIVVCFEEFTKQINANTVAMPWQIFLKSLWGGEVL